MNDLQKLFFAINQTCERYDYRQNEYILKKLLTSFFNGDSSVITKEYNSRDTVSGITIDSVYKIICDEKGILVDSQISFDKKIDLIVKTFLEMNFKDKLSLQENRAKLDSYLSMFNITDSSFYKKIEELLNGFETADLDLSKEEVLITIIEYAYRLKKIKDSTYRSEPLINLMYGPFHQKELDNYQGVNNYLDKLFNGVNKDNLLELVKRVNESEKDKLNISVLYCYTKGFPKDPKINYDAAEEYVSRADNIKPNAESTAIFDKFEDKEFLKKVIALTGGNLKRS